jgi:hypothetical protein
MRDKKVDYPSFHALFSVPGQRILSGEGSVKFGDLK